MFLTINLFGIPCTARPSRIHCHYLRDVHRQHRQRTLSSDGHLWSPDLLALPGKFFIAQLLCLLLVSPWRPVLLIAQFVVLSCFNFVCTLAPPPPPGVYNLLFNQMHNCGSSLLTVSMCVRAHTHMCVLYWCKQQQRFYQEKDGGKGDGTENFGFSDFFPTPLQ